MIQCLYQNVLGRILYTFHNPVMYGGKHYVLIENDTNQRVLLRINRSDYHTLENKEGLHAEFKVGRFGHSGKLVACQVGDIYEF